MARPLRIEFEEALYHLTGRGNARQSVFADEKVAQASCDCWLTLWSATTSRCAVIDLVDFPFSQNLVHAAAAPDLNMKERSYARSRSHRDEAIFRGKRDGRENRNTFTAERVIFLRAQPPAPSCIESVLCPVAIARFLSHVGIVRR